MKHCLNKKVVAALAATAAAVYLLAPNVFTVALPLLILAACPLSMLVMMRMMSPASASTADSGDRGEEVANLRAEVAQLRLAHGADTEEVV